MTRLIVVGVMLALGLGVAGAQDATRTVDLRGQRALDQLKISNPAHFERIERIVAGLLEQPRRAETSWLRTTFNARDVQLSRGLIKTSYPPKQLLRFMLDDVRYTMYVIRSDMEPTVTPAVIRP